MGTSLRARPEAAEAVVAASFQAHVLDAAAVHDELDRLWAELGGDPANGHGLVPDQAVGWEGGDGAARAAERMGGVLLRANTLNLLAVARSSAQADRVEQAVTRLDQFYPARALILLSDPARPQAEAGLDVRIELLEQPGEKGRPTTRFECVKIAADPGADRHLATVASPLLIAELPDFLWWAGDLPDGGALFADLVEIADRLIVDSATFADPPAGLHLLAAVTRRPRHCPFVSDFAWARLAPWRQLIAQFFDAPDARPCLDCLDEVEVVYQPRGDRGGPSGFPAAALMAGWLATRLRWESLGPVERTRTGWRLRFRSGAGREVVLRLRASYDPAFRHLGAVTLTARHESPGVFSVERSVATGLMTSSESPSRPRVGRMVHARRPDDAALLGDELHEFGRDRVYEEALRFAVGLMPERRPG